MARTTKHPKAGAFRQIDPIKAAIGARIAEARKRRGLRQVELAEVLGVSVSAVGQWERGWTMADMDNFDRLPSVLSTNEYKVTREWLLTGNHRSEQDRALDVLERALLRLYRMLPGDDRIKMVNDLEQKLDVTEKT